MDTPDRVITELNESDFKYLNRIQYEADIDVNLRYKFLLEWSCGQRKDEVDFNWCMLRNYDYRGNAPQTKNFEVCLTQRNVSLRDRITFFNWNNKDFTGKEYSNRLIVTKRITRKTAAEIQKEFKADFKQLVSKYNAVISITSDKRIHMLVSIPATSNEDGSYTSEKTEFELVNQSW